jgi:hypothetical protein
MANGDFYFLFDIDSLLILQCPSSSSITDGSAMHFLLSRLFRLSPVMGKFGIRPTIQYARTKAHKVPTFPLFPNLLPIAAMDWMYF